MWQTKMQIKILKIFALGVDLPFAAIYCTVYCSSHSNNGWIYDASLTLEIQILYFAMMRNPIQDKYSMYYCYICYESNAIFLVFFFANLFICLAWPSIDN